ncbi:alpha-amylase family glycosyl hydrolase [Flavisolibacter ginsenosidimutans]|uniref:1,4-alpha-glucan branching protein n=1 Tax=Flavisolibacter ginsenosidimutans TaxID=661481 RepID=A0A5B8UII1_9BACT|nr:alpha-amylase family glycosyl hydrolase [Flavisolibacter ginsenosidimutans]QEC56368.1 1,4-alpha-glucan branching protein [Flavisolibacter ginsenosidimutans]
MQDWIQHTNIYEVNLRQYTPEGTISAFAAHLPRLKDMGVETLWFMPLTPISKKNRKGTMGSYYACSDYTSVALEFGTLDDFKTLVYQAHQMGFKVILDWVANHTGWDHWWTVEHPGWYEKDEHTGDFKKASGMDDIIELDFKNPALRKAMIGAMKFWITETGIDGFRCDLAFWVELDFWLEAKPELEKLKPLFWLGELDPLDNPEYMQVFDAAYTWRWMHKAEHFYKGQASFNELLQVLDQYQDAPGTKAWFTSNHDENSWNGTEYEKYGELAKALAVFSCTWPGLPLIYSGQELPNQKRLQFFEKDTIDWQPDCAHHLFYKNLFDLKKSNSALAVDASLQVLRSDAGEKVLVFKRSKGDKEVVVALNFSSEEKQFAFPVAIDSMTELFSSPVLQASTLSLPPWGFSVWVK